MLRVGNGAPFSSMGYPMVPRTKGHPCFLQVGPSSPQALFQNGSLRLLVLPGSRGTLCSSQVLEVTVAMI